MRSSASFCMKRFLKNSSFESHVDALPPERRFCMHGKRPAHRVPLTPRTHGRAPPPPITITGDGSVLNDPPPVVPVIRSRRDFKRQLLSGFTDVVPNSL